MKLTGKAKVLAAAAASGIGITGTSMAIGSSNNNVTIILNQERAFTNFIFDKGEDWYCKIVGMPLQNLQSNPLLMRSLKDSFSSYLEDYQDTKKIKNKYTDGFMKSCASATSESSESESYEIVLNLQQIDGEWNFDKEDLKKIFEGNWFNPTMSPIFQKK